MSFYFFFTLAYFYFVFLLIFVLFLLTLIFFYLIFSRLLTPLACLAMDVFYDLGAHWGVCYHEPQFWDSLWVSLAWVTLL
jgi:hypothetical protein